MTTVDLASSSTTCHLRPCSLEDQEFCGLGFFFWRLWLFRVITRNIKACVSVTCYRCIVSLSCHLPAGVQERILGQSTTHLSCFMTGLHKAQQLRREKAWQSHSRGSVAVTHLVKTSLGNEWAASTFTLAWAKEEHQQGVFYQTCRTLFGYLIEYSSVPDKSGISSCSGSSHMDWQPHSARSSIFIS